MIYIQKPDGTVLTWRQKIAMFIAMERNREWNNVFRFEFGKQNQSFLIPEGVTIEPKKHYYWDYAGDIIKDASEGWWDYAEGVIRESNRVFGKMQALIEQHSKINTEKP